MTNITVITPTLGERPDWLNLVIQDIKNQTVKPIEHIIRVNVNNENSYVSLNNAIKLARTEWVAICCDDDRFYPTHLETMLKMALNADLVYSGNKRIGDMDGKCNYAHNSKLLQKSNYITNPMIRKTVFDVTGGYGIEVINEDHLYYKKLDKLGYRIVGTNVITWEYRFHDRQDSKLFKRKDM